MNNEESVLFLFAIAKELKRSFECPVILLTMKDYAECIFDSLVNIRDALLQHAQPERMLELVNTFHIGWLQAVEDIENFKKRTKSTPRETIFQAIDYTVECMVKRHKNFKTYINQAKKSMPPTEKTLMEIDMEILGDLQELVTFALLEKQEHLHNSADKTDFQVTILNEIEELSNWLDKLNSSLAIQLCKMLDLTVSLVPAELAKPLQQIIDEVASNSTPELMKVTEALCSKGKSLGSIGRETGLYNEFGINKIVEKIKKLEDRISQLKNEKSSAGLMALQHKTAFLKDRLESLENLKLSLCTLKKQESFSQENDEKISTIDKNDVRIFNHLLPHQQRCRLVERLIKLWQSAINGNDRKSIISILSATTIKEEFADEMGHFTVDKYCRKIYRKEGDPEVYQLNEINKLVPVTDDNKHIYFYDECGRYYLTENGMRVYKDHANASEYILHRSGVLLKVSEEENGVEFWYDNLGRYYIDENGDHVYRDKDSPDEYHSDGLGNLIRVGNENEYYFETCPVEPMVTEESKYLKKAIGAALKTCVAEVVIALPQDPIKYLADRLEKYWRRAERRQQRVLESEQLMAERERLKSLEPIPVVIEPSVTLEDESVEDINFTQYESQMI